MALALKADHFRNGSWLCKNPKTLNRDRRSYSSETALVVRLAMEFNFKNELKNIILVAFRYFEFLHSQGQKRHFDRLPFTSGLPHQRTLSGSVGMSQTCQQPSFSNGKLPSRSGARAMFNSCSDWFYERWACCPFVR
jgi:hypothetical protein